jgi:hypothetical protein
VLARQQELQVRTDRRETGIALDPRALDGAAPEHERGHVRQVVASGEPALSGVGHAHHQHAVVELARQLLEGGAQRLAGRAAGSLEHDESRVPGPEDTVEKRSARLDGSIECGLHDAPPFSLAI